MNSRFPEIMSQLREQEKYINWNKALYPEEYRFEYIEAVSYLLEPDVSASILDRYIELYNDEVLWFSELETFIGENWEKLARLTCVYGY